MPYERRILICLSLFLTHVGIISCTHHVGRQVRMKQNEVTGINATCTADKLNVRVTLERPFHGVIYSKGFPSECRSLGGGNNEVNLFLSTSECGVKLIPSQEGDLSYVVTIEVQMDQHLQQIADQQRSVTCILPPESMVISSSDLRVAKTTVPFGKTLPNSARTGRKKSDIEFEDQNSGISFTIRNKGNMMAWMEIKGSASNPGYVTVGESTMMLIKTKLPDGVDFHVVNCTAYDGAGDASQQLLDSEGCPIEEQILPTVKMITKSHVEHDRSKKRNSIDWKTSDNKLQIAGAVFSAFKFPDRDSLHLRCSLQICRSRCDKVDCTQNENERNESRRTGRTKGENGEVLDVLEVFNSVEVFAPGIELDELYNIESYKDSGHQSSGIALLQNEKTFCMSTPKMALAFGILGLVFLCAVAVALCTLMKGRRSHYHRQIFGSEDTLIIQDSPFLRPRLHWPYVRVIR